MSLRKQELSNDFVEVMEWKSLGLGARGSVFTASDTIICSDGVVHRLRPMAYTEIHVLSEIGVLELGRV